MEANSMEDKEGDWRTDNKIAGMEGTNKASAEWKMEPGRKIMGTGAGKVEVEDCRSRRKESTMSLPCLYFLPCLL